MKMTYSIVLSAAAAVVVLAVTPLLMGQAGGPAEAPSTQATTQPTEVTLKDGLKITEVFVPTNSDGARDGDYVFVHYTGRLDNGTVFDSSRTRGKPLNFILGEGQVIKGWDEGIKGMHIGQKRTLVIPPSLAYGSEEKGPIPANSTLTFEVELMGIIRL